MNMISFENRVARAGLQSIFKAVLNGKNSEADQLDPNLAEIHNLPIEIRMLQLLQQASVRFLKSNREIEAGCRELRGSDMLRGKSGRRISLWRSLNNRQNV